MENPYDDGDHPAEDVTLGYYSELQGETEPDTSPRWVRVLVGDGGVSGQSVWVRFFADNAPHGLPTQIAEPPRAGVPDAWVVSPVVASSATVSPPPTIGAALTPAPPTQSAPALGWMTVAEAAPWLSLTVKALGKRLSRAARNTREGIVAKLSGVEAKKVGTSWRVHLPAGWRRS